MRRIKAKNGVVYTVTTSGLEPVVIICLSTESRLQRNMTFVFESPLDG